SDVCSPDLDEAAPAPACSTHLNHVQGEAPAAPNVLGEAAIEDVDRQRHVFRTGDTKPGCLDFPHASHPIAVVALDRGLDRGNTRSQLVRAPPPTLEQARLGKRPILGPRERLQGPTAPRRAVSRSGKPKVRGGNELDVLTWIILRWMNQQRNFAPGWLLTSEQSRRIRGDRKLCALAGIALLASEQQVVPCPREPPISASRAEVFDVLPLDALLALLAVAALHRLSFCQRSSSNLVLFAQQLIVHNRACVDTRLYSRELTLADFGQLRTCVDLRSALDSNHAILRSSGRQSNFSPAASSLLRSSSSSCCSASLR